VKRRRHGLDLLPLLDVFMVVLFVFATIQEHQLGDSATASAAMERELAARERELAAMERELATLRARAVEPVAAELAAASESMAKLRADQAASAASETAAQGALAEARRAQAELLAAMDELRAAAEAAAKTGTTAGAEVLRQQEILARLLDHFSVFEIEVDGEVGGDGVINHCCYRTEPIDGAWTSCGRMPAVTAELQDWLAEGGAGLMEALRRTRGGNALTIVRQNERATWRIGRKLEEQLRDRFPDHKIYGEGVALHAVACQR
jgi:hypothetical protein